MNARDRESTIRGIHDWRLVEPPLVSDGFRRLHGCLEIHGRADLHGLRLRLPGDGQDALAQAEEARWHSLGVHNGEIVTLETRRGALDVPVWIDGRGAPPVGSLFVPFFDETLLINRLTLEAHDPWSKQPDYKKCAARVRKRSAQPAATR